MTLRMIGRSTRLRWNARRLLVWWIACDSACRIKPGRADGEIEPRHMRHLDDGADAAALLAEHHGVKVVELHLAAGVRLVAALVLEALQLEAVAAAVRQPAGGKEAGQSLVGLRERQEEVAHRHREEPLVAGDEVRCARTAPRRGRTRGRHRRAQVGAALLLRHRHADRDAGLLLRVDRARVVGGPIDQRAPIRRAAPRSCRSAGIEAKVMPIGQQMPFSPWFQR